MTQRNGGSARDINYCFTTLGYVRESGVVKENVGGMVIVMFVRVCAYMFITNVSCATTDVRTIKWISSRSMKTS